MRTIDELDRDMSVLTARFDGMRTVVDAQVAESRLLREVITKVEAALRGDIGAIGLKIYEFSLTNERSKTQILVTLLVATATSIVTLGVSILNHVL